MGVLQLVSRLASVTGMASDTAENVIHMKTTTDPSAGQVTAVMEAFRDFYIVSNNGQPITLASCISESISRAANACSILAYHTNDETGATPFGSPIGSLNFTMAAAANSEPYPEEVAFVISYNGDLTDVPISEPNPTPPPAVIRPAQRRKGRLYLGPLEALAGTTGASICRPTSQFRSTCLLSFQQLHDEIGLSTLNLGVWSRADAEVYNVVECHVDDAWDTQRRRGVEPTLRQTQAL